MLTTNIARCQISTTETPQVLEVLFDRLVDNYNDTDRLRINDSIIMVLDSYIKSDSVFTQRFTNLRYLGQIISPDSLLKIITWNLVLENEPGRYYCYFIKKSTVGKSNKVFKLSAAYNENKVKTDTIYSQSNWYGALYYDIKPFLINTRHCWVLLGIDYGNLYITRKIIEVLSFTPEDSIVFGMKWFASDDKIKYRDVFEYSSEATMSLRFKSDSSIFFDHLVSFSPLHKEDHQYFGPDYSFDAYNLDGGIWKMKINVDARNKE